MADVLKDALAFLTKTFAEQASVLATYARGYDSAQVHTTMGRKVLRQVNVDGLVIVYTSMDHVIPAAEIDFGDGPVIPQRGDFIYVDTPHGTEAFEVLPMGDEDCYRWADPLGQTQLRIHTKNVDAGQFS